MRYAVFCSAVLYVFVCIQNSDSHLASAPIIRTHRSRCLRVHTGDLFEVVVDELVDQRFSLTSFASEIELLSLTSQHAFTG